MSKVLVVATSRETQGGITSVVKAHERGKQWTEFHCRWIETHHDGGAFTKLWWFAKGFAKYIAALHNYDIVHVHISEPPSAIRKMPFLKLAKWSGKKIVLHFHSFSPDTTFRGKHKGVYDTEFHLADKLILLSPMWKRLVKETFPDLTNIEVVFNPCTAEMLLQKYDKKNSILFAGALNQRKGYKDMFEAFARIAEKYPDWRLTVAGDGELDEAKKLAKLLGIDKQVDFLGWVSGADKDRAFKEARIFCLPSYAEGFPMAVLDAWAYCLPVVTTPVGGIPDIAKDGENVLLFQPGDIDKMSECFSNLIDNKALRDAISANSHSLAETIFSVDTINKNIASLYSSIS